MDVMCQTSSVAAHPSVLAANSHRSPNVAPGRRTHRFLHTSCTPPALTWWRGRTNTSPSMGTTSGSKGKPLCSWHVDRRVEPVTTAKSGADWEGEWRVPWEFIPGIPLRIGIFLLEYFSGIFFHAGMPYPTVELVVEYLFKV